MQRGGLRFAPLHAMKCVPGSRAVLDLSQAA
jgi:hypothetical protein